MTDHPFSDLTEEELQELVDFCRELFIRPQCDLCKEIPTPPHTIHGDGKKVWKTGDKWEGQEWKWQKGDWFYYNNGVWLIEVIKDDAIYAHGPGGIVPIFNLLPTDPIVPLPLSHQWMEQEGWPSSLVLAKMSDDTYEGQYVKGKVAECHKNIHFASYKAFRGAVEEKPKKSLVFEDGIALEDAIPKGFWDDEPGR